MRVIDQYISVQSPERRKLMEEIHAIIIAQDKAVEPVIEPMMGKEMIIYKQKGMMKYGLASVKQYMSLHVLPIYGSSALHTKYEALLPKVKFQKGCINFASADDMPLGIVQKLMADCAKINLYQMRQDYLNQKKAGKKPKA